MDLKEVNINNIREGYHPRKDFSGHEELKEGIEKEKGIREPITVRPEKDDFILVEGKRRLLALKELGWETSVPCIIKHVDEKTAAHLSYLSNSEDLRNNLNPIEVSLHIKEMRERFGYTVQELVDLGYAKDDQTIYNKLNLLNLPQDIQEKIVKKEITPTEGYKIGAIKDPDLQSKVIENVCGMKERSTRKTKRIIKNLIDSVNDEKDIPDQVPEIPQGSIPGVFIKDASDMSELNDESVGLGVTSPPYGVGMEYEEGVSFEDHIEMLRRVFSEHVRVLIPGRKICVNFGDIHNSGTRKGGKPEIKLMGHHYQEILHEHGLRLIDTIIWKKCRPGKRDFNWSANPQVNYHEGTRHTSYHILNNTEYIYIFEKGGQREVPFDIEYKSKISKDEWKWWVDGVWEIPPVKGEKGHPAPFPEELVKRLILMYSYKGDLILDCFGGTMTTVKVANELGRIGIGYEKNEKYKPEIIKKLGIKEEDLKNPESKEDRSTHGGTPHFIDQCQNSIAEILKEKGKTPKDIVSVGFPLKGPISKEDISIQWATGLDEPDPPGSTAPPRVMKADGYETENDGKVTAKSSASVATKKIRSDGPLLNTNILGDSFEIIKQIENNSVDLCLTSPPYSDVKSYGQDVRVYDPDEYVDWILPLFHEIHRVTKPSGSFILNINDRVVDKQRHPFVHELIVRTVKETALKLYDTYFWKKPTALPNGNSRRLNNVTEYIIHFCKDPNLIKWRMDEVRESYSINSENRCRYPVSDFNLEVDQKGRPKSRKRKLIQLNPKGKIPSNVFHFPTGAILRGKKHPAAFHPELPSWFIKALTEEGDLVIDVFAGSGTTCLAAKMLNRNYIGMEISPVYQEEAMKRVETAPIKKAA